MSDPSSDPPIYDEIELEDLTYDSQLEQYTYPCPCGDQFAISVTDMRDGEDIAVCPSCSLRIRVVFGAEDLPPEDDVGGEKVGMEVVVGS